MKRSLPLQFDSDDAEKSAADGGLRPAMTVPGQRSTTERATAAHQVDDARQISIHSASLARNCSRQRRLQSTRPRNTAATTHKVRHLG